MVLAILSILLFSFVFVPSSVKVTPGRVTLFNLAATYTEDPTLLSEITLAFLPEGTHTLSASYIENMARRKGVEVTFESSVITVVAEATKVNAEEETPQIVLELASEVISEISSVSECLDATYDILQVSGRGSEIRRLEYRKLGKGLFSVLARTDEGFLYMLLNVSCWKKGWIAKNLIRYGEVISPDLLEEATVDAFKVLGTPASSDLAFYARAMRTFRPGDVIIEEGIRRKPDVVKGQVILAYVQLPALRITAFVRALHDAYVGEVLRAVNVSSGKIVEGVLEEGPMLKVLEVRR